MDPTVWFTQGQGMHLGPSSAEETERWSRPINLSEPIRQRPKRRARLKELVLKHWALLSLFSLYQLGSFPTYTQPHSLQFQTNSRILYLKRCWDIMYSSIHDCIWRNWGPEREKTNGIRSHCETPADKRQTSIPLDSKNSVLSNILHNFLLALVNIVSIFIFRASQRNLATMEWKIW